MNTNDQIKAVQPLLSEIANILHTGQHPGASPRFKPEATAIYNGPIRHVDGFGDFVGPFSHSITAPEIGQNIYVNNELRFVRDIESDGQRYQIALSAVMPEATAQPKRITALSECAEWLDKQAEFHAARPAAAGRALEGSVSEVCMMQFKRWARAVREADEQ